MELHGTDISHIRIFHPALQDSLCCHTGLKLNIIENS